MKNGIDNLTYLQLLKLVWWKYFNVSNYNKFFSNLDEGIAENLAFKKVEQNG